MTTVNEALVDHQGLWDVTSSLPAFEPLERSLDTDVCIVGAGIAGLSAAYFLQDRGLSVVILDDGRIAGGMTRVTTAHLTNAIDDRYFEIERIHGIEGARLAGRSHGAAIDAIERVVHHEKIDCEFERVPGFLFLAEGDDEELLERELASAHRAGLNSVTRLSTSAAAGFDCGPCLHFPNQGQFHPLRYLTGVVRAIVERGGRIFTRTHADSIEEGRVVSGSHTLTARSIVVATNTPINDRVAIHTKQAPYMTYAIGAHLPRGALQHALWWDTGDPYHYVRLSSAGGSAPDREVLIVGGEDHKTGQADDSDSRHDLLENWARARFPMIEDVAFRWAGQVMETIDGLAFIGRNPGDEHIYIATGDSGQGMTHGTIAGLLLSDLIAGIENPWVSLYDPSRKSLRAFTDLARENLNVAAQYADWARPGEVASADDVAAGDGAILRKGLSLVAVFRDSNGALHQYDAACPHLGCVVQWNRFDRSWDCPCHGSRFDPMGVVFNGPANRNLSPHE
ncbi:MAG: FAD-dependent oxidoreductase [Gemmatimonadota bacterium]